MLDASKLRMDKEADGGCWVLTYAPYAHTPQTQYRLRVNTGGRDDWYSFSAELLEDPDELPTKLAHFDITPLELWPGQERLRAELEVTPWYPADEPDFLEIPKHHRLIFVELVHMFASLAALVTLAPGWTESVEWNIKRGQNVM